MDSSEKASPQQLLPDALTCLAEVVSFIRGRNALSADEAEEFASIAKLKILENDYAILRAFRAESALRTYLSVVIQRLFLDYRRSQWGTWRPSTKSKRLGPLAVELEILIHRDGRPIEEAIQTLRFRHGNEKRAEIEALAKDISLQRPVGRPGVVDGLSPERLEMGGPHPGGASRSGEHPDVDSHGSALDRMQREEVAGGIATVLSGVLNGFSSEDRLILRMHFQDDLTVAAVSRALRLDQKALYGRIDRLLDTLRRALERAGIGGPQVADLLGRADVELGFAIEPEKNSGNQEDTTV